jgi:DNA-binding response OmpR family regulator
MVQSKSILIIEDEADLAELLRFNLEREGYTCRCAADGASAREELQRRPPDLVVLDRMLPHTSGDELLSQMKRDPVTASIPVIMLTAKADEADELVGFALGADDYIGKPFSMKLLVARVGALFRRSYAAEQPSEVLHLGPVRLDVSRHELTVDQKPVAVTATEFRLVRALIVANGKVLTRAQLIEAALGTNAAVTDRTIDVHVKAVRKKLGDAADWIQTVRGVGYTFREPI